MPLLQRCSVACLLILTTGCVLRSGRQESTSEVMDVRVENPAYVQELHASGPNEILICSFNIKFLGFYASKRNDDIVNLLRPCDLALIQELVSTPEDMPHLLSDAGNPLAGDQEAKDFFERMKEAGFQSVLSPEDTGPNRNHVNNTESEWFVAFYRPAKVEAWQEYTRFLGEPLVSHPAFARVPFAFGFKAKDGRGQVKNDFVLISVHLASDAIGDTAHDDRRKELTAIKAWILEEREAGSERDFFVLGDMNIRNTWELGDFLAVPPEEAILWSLNWRGYGTNLHRERPYEQILFHPDHSEQEIVPKMEIVDITQIWDLRSFENNGKFAEAYSDHLPVAFRLKIVNDDD